MRRSGGLLAVTLFLVAASPGASAEEVPPPEAYRLRLEYRQWVPILTSEVQNGSGGDPGTLLDGEKDLGIEDKRTFEVSGVLQMKPRHKLRGSYTRLDYDGDTKARKTFRFDDTTFNRFTQVVTSLKGAYYRGEYQFDIVRGARGFLGGLVGAKVFDVDYVIVAPSQGDREVDTVRLPIPVLGAIGRVYTGRVSFAGELSGLSIGKRGSVWELDLSARLHLSDRLAVEGGYRLLSLHAEDKPDLVDFHQEGWNFGLEISL